MSSSPLAPVIRLDGAAPRRAAGGVRALLPAAPARVLYVITTSDFGGGESFLERLVERLDRRRVSPRVCSLCPAGRAGRRIAAAGVPVASLGMSARPRGGELAAGALALARQIDAEGIDLVHGLLYRANAVAALACRLARRRPPMVWGQHSVLSTEGRGTALAARWTRPLATRVVAVAGALRDEVVARGRIPPGRVVVIGNGVDVERFVPADGGERRRALGLAPADVVVGGVGRLAPEKGFAVLVEAVALARAAGAPLALVLAGDGPERGALERLAARRRIGGSVRLLGFDAAPEALYPAFDIFALPSLEEGSPLALLEAMACGRAAVATPVGGVAEIVEPERSGLLVEAGSAAALAGALRRLAADADWRRELGAAARRRAVESFDLAAMVRRHESLYLSLL